MNGLPVRDSAAGQSSWVEFSTERNGRRTYLNTSQHVLHQPRREDRQLGGDRAG